jgi:hypothetical protein
MRRHPQSTTLRGQEFERAVAAMAEDPEVQAECAAIAKDFAIAGGETDTANKRNEQRMNTDEHG